MKIRSTSAILASLLIIAALGTSCSDEPTSGTVTDAVTETAPVTEAEPDSLRGERLPSSLPADLDLAGEAVRIWYFTQSGSTIESCVNIAGDVEGDIVDVAMYNTNRQIEDDLNVILDFKPQDVKSGSTGDEIRKLAMAAEDLYDIYTVCQWNAVSLATEHVFLDLSDAPYFNFGNPWWSKAYIDACSLGKDHLYFLAGDVSLDMIRCISAFYFNQKLLLDLDFNVEDLYAEVLDGKWTADRMMTYANAAYSDINGNGKGDAGDRFGLFLNISNGPDALSFGMGLQLTARDANNYPYLTGELEHNVNVFEKMQLIINESDSVLHDWDDQEKLNWFIEGNALFQGGFLYTSERLRDMEDDFGIVPFPKYDESQENYISIMHDITSLMCVPTTNSKLDTTCAVLEALAYYNYYDVTPVYYEDALKVKYSRDDMTPMVVDMIRDSVTTDMSYIYIPNFNDLGRIMRDTAIYKKYASTYARKIKATQKKLDNFIAAFEEEID